MKNNTLEILVGLGDLAKRSIDDLYRARTDEERGLQLAIAVRHAERLHLELRRLDEVYSQQLAEVE